MLLIAGGKRSVFANALANKVAMTAKIKIHLLKTIA
jgi:hypothetical protein